MSTLATMLFVCLVALGLGWLAALLVHVSVARLEVRSSRWLAVAAAIPAAVVLAAAYALLSPGLGGACHCAAHGHHPHLCVAHPTLTAAVAGAAVAGLVWAGRALARATGIARDTWTAGRWLRRLDGQVLVRRGARLRLVKDEAARAMTVGLLQPETIVTTSLWDQLDERERDAVALHEGAHVERRDGLTLWALHLGLAFLPATLAARLLDRWKTAAELACDRAAAAGLGDGAEVARAFVTCARLQHSALHPSALGVAASPLEARVRALLEQPPPPAEQTGSDLVWAAAAVGAFAAATAVLPGDALHHAVETVFASLL
jgi:beta-lactamase regulating signal transducer with metallopeptidase domain